MSKKVKSNNFGTFIGTYTGKEIRIKFPIRMCNFGEQGDMVIDNQEKLDVFIGMIDDMVEREGKFFKNLMLRAFLYGLFEYKLLEDLIDLGLVERVGGMKSKKIKKELHRGEILLTNVLHHISISNVYYKFYKEGHVRRILMQIDKTIEGTEEREIRIKKEYYELKKTDEDYWIFKQR